MALAYSSNHGQGLEQRQPPPSPALVKGRNIEKHEKVALILRIKRARFWFQGVFDSHVFQ